MIDYRLACPSICLEVFSGPKTYDKGHTNSKNSYIVLTCRQLTHESHATYAAYRRDGFLSNLGCTFVCFPVRRTSQRT